LRQFIDGHFDMNGEPITVYNYFYQANYDEFGGKWMAIPLGIDSAIAASAGFQFEEVFNTVERRRERYGKPLRWRKKVGRKPIGDHAMSPVERVRKHRAKKKVKSAGPSNER
jgi:hypothetical protein